MCVVDTSAEIAGDGDESHAAIGEARRFFVHSAQEHTMIEVVQNHTPQIIIIDEIGTKAQVRACNTIRERGVAMVATAVSAFSYKVLGSFSCGHSFLSCL